MLEIKNIKKTFDNGFVALDRVNLSVEKGEFVVLLGPSGSGKTTLLRCIVGLLDWDKNHGRIEFFNKDTSEDNKKNLRNHLGFVFQEFNLIENLSTINNVLTGLLHSSNKLLSMLYLFDKNQKLLALNALDRVGLLNKAHTRVSHLSGGQKQRVGIARAIVKKPILLLADEPVASLDPVKSIEIMSLLRNLSKELGITVICSLHQVNLALEFSDRIIGLADGKIVLNSHPDWVSKVKIQKIYSRNLNGLSF